MNSKNLKMFGLAITYDFEELDYYSKAEQYLNEEIRQLYFEVQKGQDKTYKKIIKYIKKHPNIPVFKNYLSSWYQIRGNQDKAVEVLKKTIAKHPNYTYAKVGYADHLLQNENYKDFETLMGKNLDLNEAVANRKVFHMDEVFTFYLLTYKYLILTDKPEAAEKVAEMLKALDPEHPKISSISHIKTAAEQLKAEIDSEEVFSSMPSVKAKPFHTFHLKGEAPKFHFKNEIAHIYNCETVLEKEFLRQLEKLDQTLLAEDILSMLKDMFNKYPEDDDYEVPLDFAYHALFLAGYFKVAAAKPILFKVLEVEENFNQFWFSYEAYDLLIPVVWELNVSSEECIEYIKKPNIECFNKSVFSTILSLNLFNNGASKDRIVSIYKDLLQFLLKTSNDVAYGDTTFNAFFIYDSAIFKLVELELLYKQFFDKELVNIDIFGEFEDIQMELYSAENRMPDVVDFSYELFYKEEEEEDYEIQDLDLATYDSDESDYYTHTTDNELPKVKDKVGRNEPCPCGSGKKYKKCCL